MGESMVFCRFSLKKNVVLFWFSLGDRGWPMFFDQTMRNPPRMNFNLKGPRSLPQDISFQHIHQMILPLRKIHSAPCGYASFSCGATNGTAFSYHLFTHPIYPMGLDASPEGLDTTTWYYSLLPGYHRRVSWVRWGQLIDRFVDAQLATQKYSLLILVIISNYNPIPLECSSNIILRHAQKPAQGQCFGIYQTTNLKPSMLQSGQTTGSVRNISYTPFVWSPKMCNFPSSTSVYYVYYWGNGFIHYDTLQL